MMQGRIIFLLEEPSMRVLLDDWLPRLFPGWVAGQHFQCAPHFSNPDVWRKPSVEVKRLVPAFQKNSGARVMAQHLKPENNHSKSLQAFVGGVRHMAAGMGYQEVLN